MRVATTPTMRARAHGARASTTKTSTTSSSSSSTASSTSMTMMKTTYGTRAARGGARMAAAARASPVSAPTAAAARGGGAAVVVTTLVALATTSSLFGDAALASVVYGDDIIASSSSSSSLSNARESRREVAQVAERTRARSRMAGKYADRKHPGCYREIFDDGRVKGEDGDPGCGEFSRAGGAARPWSLSGTIDVNDGSIFIDFSPKGGPKNLLGLYVDADGAEGVSFPDGNTWVKIDK